MANYYGQFRSNYFKVKDAEAFLAWAARIDVTVHEGCKAEREGTFGVFTSDNSDSGSVPCYESLDTDVEEKPEGWTDEEFAEEMREFDFLEELATHLAPGEVAIVMETGAEKLRYLNGWAGAINSEGERIDINLSDIYKKAKKKFGVEPSKAEY